MTLLMSLPRYIPSWLAYLQGKYYPVAFESMAQRYLQLSNQKAKEVMREAGLDLEDPNENAPVGSGNERDVLSVLGTPCFKLKYHEAPGHLHKYSCTQFGRTGKRIRGSG